MKVYSILLVGFTIFSTMLMVGCKKNGKCNEDNISESGGDDSHNFGVNCMTCHKSGGEGEGCFTVAGSVSDSLLSTNLTSGIVRLYTQPNGTGTLKHTIQIDSKGNFHTTESVSIDGLYAAITGPSGQTQYMPGSLSSGECNSCHGSSASKLWAK